MIRVLIADDHPIVRQGVQKIIDAHPDMRVEAEASEEQFAIRALKAGAGGYLTKETVPDELVRAIRTVVSGRHYLSSTLGDRLATTLVAGNGGPEHERLSDREYQVFRRIAVGRTSREISAELSLSVKTLATYRARVLEKMGMRTNAELVSYAVRNRLAE